MNTTHCKEPTEQKEKQKDGLLLDAISLRDYFAAKAIQGFMANKSNPMRFDPENDASWAYTIADAMLKAREQK